MPAAGQVALLRLLETREVVPLGATRPDIGQTGEETWVVLADPEGNEFCILRSANESERQ